MEVKYIVIDNLDNTEKVLTEKELRDFYNNIIDTEMFNFRDCEDREVIKAFFDAKNSVYVANIKDIIMGIYNYDGFYEIKEVK